MKIIPTDNVLAPIAATIRKKISSMRRNMGISFHAFVMSYVCVSRAGGITAIPAYPTTVYELARTTLEGDITRVYLAADGVYTVGTSGLHVINAVTGALERLYKAPVKTALAAQDVPGIVIITDDGARYFLVKYVLNTQGQRTGRIISTEVFHVLNPTEFPNTEVLSVGGDPAQINLDHCTREAVFVGLFSVFGSPPPYFPDVLSADMYCYKSVVIAKKNSEWVVVREKSNSYERAVMTDSVLAVVCEKVRSATDVVVGVDYARHVQSEAEVFILACTDKGADIQDTGQSFDLEYMQHWFENETVGLYYLSSISSSYLPIARGAVHCKFVLPTVLSSGYYAPTATIRSYYFGPDGLRVDSTEVQLKSDQFLADKEYISVGGHLGMVSARGDIFVGDQYVSVFVHTKSGLRRIQPSIPGTLEAIHTLVFFGAAKDFIFGRTPRNPITASQLGHVLSVFVEQIWVGPDYTGASYKYILCVMDIHTGNLLYEHVLGYLGSDPKLSLNPGEGMFSGSTQVVRSPSGNTAVVSFETYNTITTETKTYFIMLDSLDGKGYTLTQVVESEGVSDHLYLMSDSICYFSPYGALVRNYPTSRSWEVRVKEKSTVWGFDEHKLYSAELDDASLHPAKQLRVDGAATGYVTTSVDKVSIWNIDGASIKAAAQIDGKLKPVWTFTKPQAGYIHITTRLTPFLEVINTAPGPNVVFEVQQNMRAKELTVSVDGNSINVNAPSLYKGGGVPHVEAIPAIALFWSDIEKYYVAVRAPDMKLVDAA